MKYLIVPDIHNQYEWAEGLVAAYPDHQPVFLGDYFDSFYDTATMAGQTAQWLRYSINCGNRIHLMGNHDLPYRWRHMNCPGYRVSKAEEVRKYLTHEDWQRVGLYHVITPENDSRPLILSHAGFTLANLYGVSDYRDVAKGGRLEFLRERTTLEHLEEIRSGGEEALQAAYDQKEHFWFNQGTRMGESNIGGPFWIDFHEIRSPLPGIDQLVGHTIIRDVPLCHYYPNKKKPGFKWWCIDVAGSFAAIVDTEEADQGGMKITPIHARGELFGVTSVRTRALRS
jgi:hypothetical protein